MFLDPILGWFSNDLAIDLGTANTLVYVKGSGHGSKRSRNSGTGNSGCWLPPMWRPVGSISPTSLM